MISGGLTKAYNVCSGFSGSTPAPASVASQSLLSCVAPNINTNVKVDTSQTVNKNLAGAGALAQKASAGLQAAQQDVQATKAACVESIRTAQAEIMAACVVNEVQPGAAFPDMSMAPDSAVELALDIIPTMQGGGSFTTALMAGNNMSLAGDIAAGMRDRPSAEVMDMIKNTLVANSAPGGNEGFGGLVTNATDSPQTAACSIDWETTLAQHPEALEAIMYCDPENPNPEFFPELVELNTAEVQIENKLAELAAVEAHCDISSIAVECNELPPAQMVDTEELGGHISDEVEQILAEMRRRAAEDLEAEFAVPRPDQNQDMTMVA